MRYSESTLAELRSLVMKKGQAVANQLAEVLAGKGKDLDLGLFPDDAKKPGLRPEERLRLFLDHLEETRKRIDAQDDAFGRCTICGKDLGLAALRQMPWADRCQEHATTPAQA